MQKEKISERVTQFMEETTLAQENRTEQVQNVAIFNLDQTINQNLHLASKVRTHKALYLSYSINHLHINRS